MQGGQPVSFVPITLSDSVPTAFANNNVAALVADLQGNNTESEAFLSGSTVQLRVNNTDGSVHYYSVATGLSPVSTSTPILPRPTSMATACST